MKAESGGRIEVLVPGIGSGSQQSSHLMPPFGHSKAESRVPSMHVSTPNTPISVKHAVGLDRDGQCSDTGGGCGKVGSAQTQGGASCGNGVGGMSEAMSEAMRVR